MLTRIALKFRVITLLILALVIASGIWSASKLQLELLPDVEFPLFTVFTYYEDGAPQDVLDDVTIPLESIAAELEGVDNYVSTSSPMSSLLIIEFEFGTDIPAAAAQMQELVDELTFPEQVLPPEIIRLNPDEFPILTLSALGDRSPEEMAGIINSIVVPTIKATPGVQKVDITTSLSSISRTNGKPSAGISLTKTPAANTVTVANDVLQELDLLKQSKGVPSDVEFVVISNQAPQIQSSIDKLRQEVLLGAVLAVLVIFSFLISFRPTFVTGITIPASLLMALVVMNFQNMSLNIMTLGGLAIAAGRVVDDSIVVMENIFRHIQMGEKHKEAAINATKEVLMPITVSTITTIAVFLPLGFIDGIIGTFFRPFALTITYALIASLFVSITVVPVLGSMLIKLSQSNRTETKILNSLQNLYTPALDFAIKHKAITLVSSLLLFILGIGLIPFIPISFIPGFEQKVLSIEVNTDQKSGLAIIETLDDVESQLEVLRLNGEALAYYSTVGGFSEEDFTLRGGDTANILLNLDEEADIDSIEDDLRENLQAPGRTVFISRASGGGPASDRLQLTLAGENYTSIVDTASKIVTRLSSEPDLINIRSDATAVSDNPFLQAMAPIRRVNGTRAITISGIITSTNTQGVSRQVDLIVSEIGLPEGVELAEGGVFADIQESFTQMGIAMAIGVLLVYLVMVVSQRSLLTPFIIVFSIPLASIGAFGALFITQRALGLPALMGLLMLIGLVVTNAIVLIAFVDELRKRGATAIEALKQGGKTRLRPILMTAMTTSFVLVPLALESENQGSGIIGAELATVIIGGLATSTFLTLLVVPVIYSIFKKDKDPKDAKL